MKKKNLLSEDWPLFSLFLSLFLIVLSILSLQKFKYSHYLMALYPAAAVLAAYTLFQVKHEVMKKVEKIVFFLSILTALVLLTFPLTSRVRRDKELHHIAKLFKQQKEYPTAIGIMNGVYPFFAAANFFGFENHSEVVEIKEGFLREFLKNGNLKEAHAILDFPINLDQFSWGFLIPKSQYESLKNEFSKEIIETLHVLAEYPKQKMVLLIEKKLSWSDGILLFKN